MKITKFVKATAGGFLLLIMSLLSSAPGFAQGARFDVPFLKPLASGGVTPVSGLLTVCPGNGLVTTAASVTSNVATLTFGSSPITAGFVSGRNVFVFGFSGTDIYFNGTFAITGVTSSTVTYALTHANNSASTTGGAIQTPTASSGCSPTTTVYSDQLLSTPITQPFGTDPNGNAQFWASPGTYYVALSASGVNPIPFNVATIPLVPNANGTYTLGTISVTSISTATLSASGQITSTVSTGTAPFSIASTTVVPNLNAQLHNGLTAPASAILGLTDTQSPTNKTFDITSNVPPILYNTPSASTNASITATTMANVGASGGMYRISFYADQSALGSGCSTNTTINLGVVYRDPNSGSNHAETVGAVLTIVNNGTVGNVLTGGNAAASWVYGFRSKASNVVQYQTTYNIGTCTTGPSYTLWPILEQLN